MKFRKVVYQNRSLRIFNTRPNGSCLLESLLVQLRRNRPGIKTDQEACNELRNMLIDDLLKRLPSNDTLQSVVLCNMLDENLYDEGLSMEENDKLELKRFACRFRMNVRVLSSSA